MANNQIKIEVNSLKEGMFVANLDRPWHETPFPLQGFYIRGEDDVKSLANFCKFVFVDMQRRSEKTPYTPHSKFNPKKQAIQVDLDSSSPKEELFTVPNIVIKSPETYERSLPMKKEVVKATKLHKQVYSAIDNIYSAIQKGEEISVKETESVAEGMVESVVRNPDALVWLAKMEEDAHGYRHSVQASIWALVFGRHLGLDKKMLKTLAMGVLMSHVGKTKLDPRLVEQEATLEGEDKSVFQSYVDRSIEILSQMPNVSRAIITIAKHHRERHNGSGFPQGIKGDQIPLLAKIAGLVDHYQSLITPRGDHKGLSPLDAATAIYELRNIEFQQDLVERFIEAVGVYPTGTLVELNSKEIGIVTGHNEDRRLMPKIMIVMDEYKQPMKSAKLIDLKEWNQSRERSELLLIKDSLPKGAYDIDESSYLLSGATSKWSWKHISSAIAG